jgi:hypothetical protein
VLVDRQPYAVVPTTDFLPLPRRHPSTESINAPKSIMCVLLELLLEKKEFIFAEFHLLPK